MGNCLNAKVQSKRERALSKKEFLIQGSHEEHHLKKNKVKERPSQVRITQGVHQLKMQYTIDKKPLGKGAFGKVYKAVDKKNQEHKVAIKVLNKSKMSAEELAHVMDEVDLLKSVDHPNIVEYFETYDDQVYLYLVMELCTGGELFDSKVNYCKDGKPYTERSAADVIQKCLEALQHCHALGITHRDIKPENIMFGNDGEVRLVDFGLAKETQRHMHTYAGTPYFMAPEVIKGDYTHKCDIWSLACVLYMLAAGELPYKGKTRDEVFGKIKRASYEEKSNFSEALSSLLAQMFTLDPRERPTAQECLRHPWFQILEKDARMSQMDDALSMDIVSGLQNFHGKNILRKSCLQILVKMINPKEFRDLRREFNKIDTNFSGTIEIDELRTAVQKCHSGMDEEELNRVLHELDFDGTGIINYHNFIAATFPIEKYLTRERVESLFTKFDTEGHHYLTTTNLRDAFTKLGHHLTQEEIDEIMAEHDLDHGMELTYEEFETMLKQNL